MLTGMTLTVKSSVSIGKNTNLNDHERIKTMKNIYFGVSRKNSKGFFTCLAIKPNDIDDLEGFRCNLFGLVKFKYNKRQYKSRGFKIGSGTCFNHLHFGKRSVYFEKRSNKVTSRRLRHFAG